MIDHKHEIVEKMTGNELIRRLETTAPDKDPAKTNLAEVSRIPEKKSVISIPGIAESPLRNASLILQIHLIVMMIWIHLLSAKVEDVGTTRKSLRKKRRAVIYGEQSCDSGQGQEATPIKEGIRAIQPIDESAIDQSANGNNSQTTLANSDSTTKQIASKIGIRETVESFFAQFGQDSAFDPEVIAQVLSPSQI